MHGSQLGQKYSVAISYQMRKIQILSVLMISNASSFSLTLARSLDPWKCIQVSWEEEERRGILSVYVEENGLG